MTATRFRYGVVICNRCGWLLRVEPCSPTRVDGADGTLVADDVFKVMDPQTGKVYQKEIRKAIQKVIENWKSRGLAKVEVDQINGRYGIQLPSHESMFEEGHG